MTDDFDNNRSERGEVGLDDNPTGATGPDARAGGANADFSEADILRDELTAARSETERLSEELVEAKDRLLRTRAEFDTLRRRLAGEIDLATEAGANSVVLPVLKVFDDLERALAAAGASEDPSSIVPGVRAVREGLLRDLQGLGISQLGEVGEYFDPELHEALTVVPPTDEVGEGHIAQVFQTGFSRNGRLIRPAKVVVAKSGAGN